MKSGRPDTIAGQTQLTDEFASDKMVSTATLYAYTDEQLLRIIHNIDLTDKTKRMLGRNIAGQPATSNRYGEIGHFKIDIVGDEHSGHESVALELIKHKNRMIILRLIDSR